MRRAIAKWIFYRLWGWKIIGEFPHHIPKYIIAVAPHTSAWDLIVGLLVREVTGLKAGFIGKDSLFRWPYGWFFRALGCHPVDRSKSSNYVQGVVGLFNSRDRLVIALAPEGTRKRVDRLKTGFYYIALGAGIPIVPGTIDFTHKEVRIFPFFFPSGDFPADMEHILQYFRGVEGKIPEYSVFF
jgi:1-acyl-sn-glycerol-3-phosphate acyltransferase